MHKENLYYLMHVLKFPGYMYIYLDLYINLQRNHDCRLDALLPCFLSTCASVHSDFYLAGVRASEACIRCLWSLCVLVWVVKSSCLHFSQVFVDAVCVSTFIWIHWWLVAALLTLLYLGIFTFVNVTYLGLKNNLQITSSKKKSNGGWIYIYSCNIQKKGM
jgi:hypothetical protein